MDRDRPSVLITGGARRIGAAMARTFDKAGWHVVIHYRTSASQAQALAGELASSETVQADLTDPAALTAMVDDLAGGLTDWRALVCSAALFEPDDAARLDPSVFGRAMATNAEAPCRLVQLYLDRARARSGRRAILVTDQKLANPNPDFFSYSLSKHALAGAIPMLAMGAAAGDDRVYGLAPGAILPSHDQNEEEAEHSHRMNLLARRTSADEVADAALFLAGGTLASGSTLYVDSGQHLLRQPRDVIYLARETAVS